MHNCCVPDNRKYRPKLTFTGKNIQYTYTVRTVHLRTDTLDTSIVLYNVVSGLLTHDHCDPTVLYYITLVKKSNI